MKLKMLRLSPTTNILVMGNCAMVSKVIVNASDKEEVLDPSTGKKRPYYTKFIDEKGDAWEYTGILPGRGQPGLAAFYKNPSTGEEILVKVDDAATCSLEGTAYFARDAAGVIPDGLKSSAIFGTAGTMQEGDSEVVVSIQPKASKFKSWDKLVYGMKRDPKTLRSYESRYHDKIEEAVEALPQKIQWQLAAGIKISGVCGDESLHVGQFVALLDDDDNIIGLQRIDFGARERYAVSREKHIEDMTPFHGSTEYTSSGQFGKDYVSYLISHPDIAQKYTILWARNFDADDLYQQSKSAFITQISNLPESERRNAVLETIATINKALKEQDKFSLSDDKSTEELIESVAEKLAALDVSRAIVMREKAVQELNNRVFYAQEMGVISRPEAWHLSTIIANAPLDVDKAFEYLDMISIRRTDNTQSNLIIDELESLIVDAIDCHAIDNTLTAEQSAILADKIDRNKVLREMGRYYEHLLASSATTGCIAKRQLIAHKMQEVRRGADLSTTFTEEFKRDISESRGIWSSTSHGSKLISHLDKLLSNRAPSPPSSGSLAGDPFPSIEEEPGGEDDAPIPEGCDFSLDDYVAEGLDAGDGLGMGGGRESPILFSNKTGRGTSERMDTHMRAQGCRATKTPIASTPTTTRPTTDRRI